MTEVIGPAAGSGVTQRTDFGLASLAMGRERYTSLLHRGAELGPPTQAEQDVISRWSPVLLPEKWGKWALSWMRALQSYGTPLDFISDKLPQTFAAHVSGKHWNFVHFDGGNYGQRRLLTLKQGVYSGPDLPFPLRAERSCKLCENVRQALAPPSPDRQNCMLDVRLPNGAPMLVLPARYPGTFLHMLLLFGDHDASDTRITADAQSGTFPTRAGHTRGRLIENHELLAMFQLAQTAEVVASRNHPLSGMSIPGHDHWHLRPRDLYPSRWFEQIAEKGEATVRRATGTPFDVLVLERTSMEQLSDEAAEVLQRLERADQIYTVTFVPGPAPFVMISTVRDGEKKTNYHQIGAVPQTHELDPGDSLVRVALVQSTPLRFEYPWREYVADSKMAPHRNRMEQEQVLKLYNPIDYTKQVEWGTGGNIFPSLTSAARNLWTRMSPLQDKRGDIGHAEVVTYFTLELATILDLNVADREAVAMAAILHDVGWSFVPEVRARFRRLVNDGRSADPAIVAAAKVEMLQLRVEHQQHAVDVAATNIQEHPAFERISESIGDHDTRIHAPVAAYRAFLDGDWLWRVTLPGVSGETAGDFNRHDPVAMYDVLRSQFTEESFCLTESYWIARLELANTMLTLQRSQGWELPKHFEEQFAVEIARLRSF